MSRKVTKRKYTRRQFIEATMAAAGTMALAACGAPATTQAPPPATQPPAAPTPQAPVVVTKEVPVTVPAAQTVLFNSNQSDPTPKQALADEVAKFMEAHPEYQVRLSTTAHEDFKQAIRAFLTADVPPDVLTWNAGNRARFFIRKGLILDISDVWQKENWEQAYAKGFQELSKEQGKYYFVPSSWYWWAVYYNKKVFSQFNLSEPKTWDELMNTCETLKSNNIIPFAIGAKAPWTLAGWFDYLNMRVNGYDFHIQLMEGQVSYTDPKVEKVFNLWKDFISKGYYLPNATGYTWEEAVTFLARGEAGMYLMGQFLMDAVPAEAKGDMDFFQFPDIDSSVGIGEDTPTDGFFAAAQAPNPDGAKALLAYLGGVEGQSIFVKETGRLAANTSVDPSLYADPATKKGIELVKRATNLAQFYDRDTPPPVAERGMATMGTLASGPDSFDVKSELAQLEQQVRPLFAEA